MQELEKIKP